MIDSIFAPSVFILRPLHVISRTHTLIPPLFPPNTIYIYIYKSKQAFLKDCLSHASSDPRLFESMTTVLSSQMFERFIEERQTEPDHPQIKVMRKGGRKRAREGRKKGCML